MATAPRPQHLEEDFNFDASKAKLPGYTVDALLAEGKVEEARAEMERLILESENSGEPALEATPEFWANLRRDLHREAGIKE